MRNDKDNQYEQIENLLGKARLSGSSSELKDRITAEATRLWNQTSMEVPWQIPVRRLAASAAAAVLMIWLAKVSASYSVARWQDGEPSATHQQAFKIDVLPDIPHGPFMKHLVSVGCKSPVIDGSGLREYVETVRRLLDETLKNDVSNPPDPIKGRSRLLLDFSDSRSYS